MSRQQIFAQKEIVIDSEYLTLFGHDDSTFTYNGVPVMGQSGLTELAAVGSTPNANGATLADTVLNLEPASASFPGVVTTGTQTFAGGKTFSNDLTAEDNIILATNSTGPAGNLYKGVVRFLTSPGDATYLGYAAGTFAADNDCTMVGKYAGGLQEAAAERNTGVGWGALRNVLDGVGNTCFGQNAGVSYNGTESENCCIASPGVAGENYQIRIGNVLHTNCYIRGIYGVTSAGATATVVNSDGLLGTVVSSRKRKREIADIEPEDLDKYYQLAAKKFKMIGDKTDEQHYGLIAEEVDEIMPWLVIKDKEGQVETVQYQKLDGLHIAALKQMKELVTQLQTEVSELKKQLQ